MSILVVGATGQTGRQIVRRLRGQGEVPKLLVRSRERAVELFGDSVEIAIVDVAQPGTLVGALTGVETLICATGTRSGFGGNGAQQVDYEGTRHLIDEAKRAAGVKRFVLVSSLCVSRLLHPLNLFGGVLLWKKKAEDYLIASGLDFTIVRPGGLREGGGGNEIIVRPADTLFEGTIDRADVARVCVEAGAAPEAAGKIVEIVGGPGQGQPSLIPLLAALPVVRAEVQRA
ncbi:SDR family oxidoreductase [Gloeobacter kilaueensis]|uniref:Ycf39 n=1 Tax=Gloeobacter kilaueensis (strain ATCC BAA-2537 / CCAP 1431/1 / ULC 316 / JS1) TaxID=1183438 RepID=U5QD98_GLOK1|nr:SDR family oxidoreductase [Gloeobacter kilaueensis]AGY56846.1 Ycf39 [Gloeobacter kilaueensis JS1]